MFRVLLDEKARGGRGDWCSGEVAGSEWWHAGLSGKGTVEGEISPERVWRGRGDAFYVGFLHGRRVIDYLRGTTF
jgi:hypothetical protein